MSGPEMVLGLDNVRLTLPVAGVGPRALAAFLDYLVVMTIGIGLALGAVALAAVLGDKAWLAFVVLLLAWFAVEYGYFAGFELGMDGQTPGKRALGLRVVDGSGGRASTRGVLVRNCVRSVDLLLGVLLMAVDPLARRLGDRLAGTLVVHEAEREQALLVRRVPRGWQPRDVAVVESFFRRRRHLSPEKARQLASRLLDAIRRDDPRLLEGVDERDPQQALRAALDVQGA